MELEELSCFTYEDFLKSIYVINETSAIYNESIQNEHDKIFKDLLSDREEAREFINSFLKLKRPIEKDMLEPYSNSYITSEYRNKEADVVYKIKDKDIFFLIEHQSTIDISMPYRIQNYCREIMNRAIQKDKIKRKDYKYPLVIPIVLYTGNKKWIAKQKFSEVQEQYPEYEISSEEYVLIDVNKYKREKLLEDNLGITKVMLIEKDKTQEELTKDIQEIIQLAKENENDKLQKAISYIINTKFSSQNIKQIQEEIKEKKGEDDIMLAVLERIEKEEQKKMKRIRMEGKIEGKIEGRIEGKKEGEKIGIMNMAKKMLQQGFDQETIYKITGLRLNS